MLIGVMGAMEEETKLLLHSMAVAETRTIGMRDYYIGKLFGKDAVLVFSRWGKVASASTVTTLVETFKVDMVIFTGVAGGADKALNIGDIVIADRLVQHDMDASLLPGYKKFEIPLLGVDYFKPEDKIVSLAVSSAKRYISGNMETDVDRKYLDEFRITTPEVVVGTIASGDQFIADSRKVQNISAEITNLKCIEMEGAAVAQVCHEHNVGFVVFRVISDKADENAGINFPKFVEKTASHFTSGIVESFISDID